MLVECNRNGTPWMLKRDLARAYRQLRTDPYDYNRLGFRWNGQFYFDISLPFGLRSASLACQRTTNALAHILKCRNINIVNYVDDLATAAPSKEAALQIGNEIDLVIEEAGLALASDKSVEATQIMTFLGISFNSINMTMEITPDRIAEIQIELEKWNNKRYATKKEIQPQAGKLQFLAKCCKY